jgi:thioredoxin reductase
VTTGLVDELPDVQGVRERWGRDVLHCPYCHGWEVRGQRIGVLGTNQNSIHQTLLFRQLSEHVTLFRHSMTEPDAPTRDRLAALNVEVVEGSVRQLRGENGAVRAVVLEDGREFTVDAVAVAPRFIARAELFEQLGGTLTEHPFGAFIEADPRGATVLPGVWAAGNASDLAAMVTAATAAGVVAGAAINADLVTEDADAAVRARAVG